MKNNVPNIVLLGHMGAGKSTIGKSLAKKLSINFIDTDCEIEKFTDTKISNILSFVIMVLIFCVGLCLSR